MIHNQYKTLIIGISGGSGSGKTSFIRDLVNDIDSENVSLISQDDYYKPRELQTRDREGIKNFDLPEAVYLDRLYDDITKLRSGEDLEIQEYTFNNSQKISQVKLIKSAPILIVEGLYVFYHKKIRDLFDLKVFVHANDVHKVIRRIERDIHERNYPMEDVIYRYQHHVQPSYQQHIEPYMWESDIIVNNNNNYDAGLKILSGYLKHYLS